MRWRPNFGVKLVRPGFGPAAELPAVLPSVAASRQLQVATRFCERHARQLPRRSGFGTRDRPHSLHQGRWADGKREKADREGQGTSSVKSRDPGARRNLKPHSRATKSVMPYTRNDLHLSLHALNGTVWHPPH